MASTELGRASVGLESTHLIQELLNFSILAIDLRPGGDVKARHVRQQDLVFLLE